MNACKNWEVEGSSYAINRIKIDAPGLTYVRYTAPSSEDGGETPSHVRVSSDSKELVDCMEVLPLPPNGVQLRFKSKECEKLHGHLLTSMTLAKKARVCDVHARGGGVVVIDEQVLVTDCEHAEVQVAQQGSGSIHVCNTTDDIHLKALHLSVAGSGHLQFVGPSRVRAREQIQLESVGSGSVTAFAGSIESPTLKSSIVGSGAVTLVPSDGLLVEKLKTSIAGHGKATYAGEGTCTIQRCSIAGSGTIDARGIVCRDATINGVGIDSQLIWQVSDSIKSSGWVSPTILYVNAAPNVVEGSVTLKPAQGTRFRASGASINPNV